jgi:hypothetical protein
MREKLRNEKLQAMQILLTFSIVSDSRIATF